MDKGEVKTQVVNELKTLLAAEINAKLANDQEARKKEREEDAAERKKEREEDAAERKKEREKEAAEWNNRIRQIYSILKNLLQIQANSKKAEIESVNAALELLNNISGAENI